MRLKDLGLLSGKNSIVYALQGVSLPTFFLRGKNTPLNFLHGSCRKLHKQPNLKYILKTSGYILVTVESACILTAETVDLIFYQYSLLLSVPLALLAGAFAVVAPEAYCQLKDRD
jgi:hypothetical protein